MAGPVHPPELVPANPSGGPTARTAFGSRLSMLLRRRVIDLALGQGRIDLLAGGTFETTERRPVQREHRRTVIDGEHLLQSIDQTRRVEARTISRVDRVYRAQRIESDEAIVVGRSTSVSKPGPVKLPADRGLDLDRLDSELWRRFEKRIRVDRERRGKG